MRTLAFVSLMAITGAVVSCSTTSSTATPRVDEASGGITLSETSTSASGQGRYSAALEQAGSSSPTPQPSHSLDVGPPITSLDPHDHTHDDTHDDTPAEVVWPNPPARDATIEDIAGFVGLVIINDHPSRPRWLISPYLADQVADDYLDHPHPDGHDQVSAVLIDVWIDTENSTQTRSVTHALYERTRHSASRFEQLVMTATFDLSPTGWVITSLEVT